MIQVLIPRQLRNGVEGLVLLSTTQKPWNSFSYLYLCGFFCLCRYKTCKFWLELKFLFLFFCLSWRFWVFHAFLPFPFLPPAGRQRFGFVSYSCRASFTSHVFCSIVCFLSCVFTWCFFPFCEMVFKTWGSPQVVKGVCLYQRMTPVPSTALAAGGKQMKRGWTTFFRS